MNARYRTAAAVSIGIIAVISVASAMWISAVRSSPSVGGEVAVHIDIKPGSPVNPINLKSAGVIPVAILSSATFSARDVDPASVVFAGAHAVDRPGGRLARFTDV